ncbi:MAG: galactosyldiacylglycerol synthase [Undibacterium sp.]|nr:galactosyldiacylglycerol synthase [Opitutaceae bacterium]
MRARILILTAGYGEGHNAAARALAAACDAAHGPGTVRVVDLFALASPRFNRLSRRAYLGTINGAPRLWSRLYAWIDRSNIVPRCLWLLGRERRLLARIIAEEQPSVLCSTYPVYAFLLARLTADGHALPPHFNVVTDSISINSLWWRAGAAGWFVPNEDSAGVMRRGGVKAERLHVSGFPVPAFFGDNAAHLSPPDLAASHTAPRVLYIINSGTNHAAETARLLLKESAWEVTIAVGRDELLCRELTLLAANRTLPAQILGWTDRIPHLLMTHHVVISKAGGATVQEAIAARCPMIVNQIVPGQEEGNYELLRRARAGALATTPAAVLTTLREAFADHGALWRRWRANLAPIVRNDAARVIAQHLLSAPSSFEVQSSKLEVQSSTSVALAPAAPAAALP